MWSSLEWRAVSLDSVGELPPTETEERNTPIDDGPGGTAGAERERERSEAELCRAGADGESQRAGGERPVDISDRDRRTGCGAVKMIEEIPGQKQVTVGADKNYDTHQRVEQLRERRVTPHVAQKQQGRRSAIDGRTKRHPVLKRALPAPKEAWGFEFEVAGRQGGWA